MSANLTWVDKVIVVSPLDHAHEAIQNNPGWRLIAAGVDPNGETILTYGWPWGGTKATEEQLKDLLVVAWGIIVNAGEGNWEETQTPEWQSAAKSWRDAWHETLDNNPKQKEST